MVNQILSSVAEEMYQRYRKSDRIALLRLGHDFHKESDKWILKLGPDVWDWWSELRMPYRGALRRKLWLKFLNQMEVK